MLASVDSHHLDHKRTEFVVIAQSVKQPTTSRVAVFNGFTGSTGTLDNKTRLTIGPDSFADVSIIAEDAVDPTWQTVEVAPIAVKGIGGPAKPTQLTTAVRIPLQLQWAAQTVFVYAYISQPPAGVDLLMGCDIIDFLGAKIDRTANRVLFDKLKLVTPLSTIADNTRRGTSAATKVIAACSGCNFVYATVRNLGFNIEKWVSIDNDPDCREITRNIVPPSQLVDTVHDVNTVPRALTKQHFDLHINTAPCQSFSRCHDTPQGFADTARAKPALNAAELHKRLRKTNPRIRKLVENVEFYPSLAQDELKFQNMPLSHWQRKKGSLRSRKR